LFHHYLYVSLVFVLRSLQQLSLGTNQATPNEYWLCIGLELTQLRLYFAMIDLIFPQQSWFLTKDDLDDEIRIAVGHCTSRKRPNGEIAVRAKSLSFGKLDQHNWRTFLDAALRLVVEKIIPGLDENDLRRELEEMLAPTP